MDEFAELAILHPENRFKESIENANESVLNRIAPLFQSEVSTNINRNDSSLPCSENSLKIIDLF